MAISSSKPDSHLAIGQYLFYFFIGELYHLEILFSTGLNQWSSVHGRVLLVFPLLLAGYISGLSLLYPKLAAFLAFVSVTPFLLIGLAVMFSTSIIFGLVSVAPAFGVVALSVEAQRSNERSFWSRKLLTKGQLIVAVMVVLPALIASLQLCFVRWGLNSLTEP